MVTWAGVVVKNPEVALTSPVGAGSCPSLPAKKPTSPTSSKPATISATFLIVCFCGQAAGGGGVGKAFASASDNHLSPVHHQAPSADQWGCGGVELWGSGGDSPGGCGGSDISGPIVRTAACLLTPDYRRVGQIA